MYTITQEQLKGLNEQAQKQKIQAYLKQFQSIELSTLPMKLSFPLSNILPKVVQISSQIKHIVNEIELKNVPDTVASFDREIKEGFNAKLDCGVCDYPAELLLEFKNGAFRVEGQLSQVRLPNVLALKSSKAQGKGPYISILAESTAAHLKTEGLLSILDLVDRPVKGHSDINGIIFRTEGPIKIFGLDFIENSFELKAGLLRINDNFIAEADLKVGPQTFDSIEKSLIEAAKDQVKPYEQAKEDYTKKNEAFLQKKQVLESVNEMEFDRFAHQKEEYKKVFDPLQKEATSALQKEMKDIKEKYDLEQKRLRQANRQAHQKAWKAHDDEIKKAAQELESQANRTQKQLLATRQRITINLNLARGKVEQIFSLIKDYQNAPWYEFYKKAALAELYASYEIAKGETAKASIAEASSAYQRSIQAVEQTYSARIKQSIETVNLAIVMADKIYRAGLEAAQAQYHQAVDAVHKAYSATITKAKAEANQRSEEFIAKLDEDYFDAKEDFNLGDLEVIIAEESLQWAEKNAAPALSFLESALSSGLKSLLKFRTVHFKFDIHKERATIDFDLTINKQTFAESMQIDFSKVPNFVALLAKRIWKFITHRH